MSSDPTTGRRRAAVTASFRELASAPDAPIPPAAKEVPSVRTYHGDTGRRVRVARRQGGPGDHRLPERGERLHPGADRAPGRAARRDLRRDQGAGPRRPTCQCRPARAAAGTTPARWRASSTACTAAARYRPAMPAPPIAPDGAPLDGEEVLLDVNQLAGGHQFFSLGAFDVSPDGRLAGLLDRLRRRRAVHAAVQGPGHGRAARRRDPRHLLRHRLVGRRHRRCFTSRWTTPGGRTGSGGTRSAPRPPGRGGLRGGRRAVLGRRRADPLERFLVIDISAS